MLDQHKKMLNDNSNVPNSMGDKQLPQDEQQEQSSEPQKSPTFGGGGTQTANPTINNNDIKDAAMDDLTDEERKWIADANGEKVPNGGVDWPSQ